MLAGVPGVSQCVRDFVSLVRLYMRDFPELNRIVAGEESSDRQIAWAVFDALGDFNGTPHLTNYSLDYLLQRNQTALLLRMTVIALIESVGLLQTRNHINYSDGGINVGVNDKTPLLMNWLQYYKASTEQLKQRTKVALNIEPLLFSSGEVHSEYLFTHGSYMGF